MHMARHIEYCEIFRIYFNDPMVFDHMQGCNSKVFWEKSGPETFRLLVCMTIVFILLSGE